MDTGHLTQSSHPWRIPSDWQGGWMRDHLFCSTQYIYLLNNRLFLVHWFKWEPSGGTLPGTVWVIFEQIFGHPLSSLVDISLCYFCVKACETVTSAERAMGVLCANVESVCFNPKLVWDFLFFSRWWIRYTFPSFGKSVLAKAFKNFSFMVLKQSRCMCEGVSLKMPYLYCLGFASAFETA